MATEYEALVSRIRNDSQLPMLPEIVLRVQEIASRTDSTAGELANVILSDGGITGKLLKLANSSLFARGEQQIIEVTRAIVVLGFKRVKNIAIGLATSETLKRLAGGGLLKEYWLHSLACAVCSQGLAQKLGSGASPEAAFVAGLLHDSGKIVLAQYHTDAYREFLEKLPDAEDPLALEREAFGYDHCAAGVALAEAWRFPQEIRRAIAGHHHLRPTEEDQGNLLENVVGLSNLIAKNLYGNERDRTPVRARGIFQLAEQLIGFNEAEVDRVVSMTGYLVDELAGCLEIDIAALKKFVSTGPQATLLDEESAESAPEQKLTDRNRWLRALNQISSQAAHAEKFHKFLPRALAEISTAFDFSGCCYLRYDAERGELVGTVGSGTYPAVPDAVRSEVKLLSGPLARCVIENRPYTVHGPEAEPFVIAAGLPEVGNSLVALPVAVSGRVQGVILGMRAAGSFDEDEIESLATIARQVAFAFANSEG